MPGRDRWALLLARGEKFQEATADGERGLTDDLPDFMFNATAYEPWDGYLLSARGNPLGNVVKKGKRVRLHSASGLDFDIPVLEPVLEQISLDEGWRNLDAKVAMSSVAKHMDSMECYACHADWAPQCHGCHITVDYSEGKTDIDWISNRRRRAYGSRWRLPLPALERRRH